MEKYAKREPKWEPKSIKNAKNAGKKACKNLYKKLMPKKSSKVPRNELQRYQRWGPGG